MPLLLGRVRGSSAAGQGARAPSFPCKRVGGAPGAYERQNGQIRKNRTRSYMNGSTATANLRKRRTLFFYVSYAVLTEFLRTLLRLRLRQRLRQRIRNAGNQASVVPTVGRQHFPSSPTRRHIHNALYCGAGRPAKTPTARVTGDGKLNWPFVAAAAIT